MIHLDHSLILGKGNGAIIFVPIPFTLNGIQFFITYHNCICFLSFQLRNERDQFIAEYVNARLLEAENTTRNLQAGEEATITGFEKKLQTSVINL